MADQIDEFQKNKLVIERLFAKIDYLKSVRLKVPIFASASNFALLILFTRIEISLVALVLFVSMFWCVGGVALYALNVIRKDFDTYVYRLASSYLEIGVPETMADRATRIWFLLSFLILLSILFPTALVLGAEFSSAM